LGYWHFHTPLKHTQPLAQLNMPLKCITIPAPVPLSSEPILFPKLRIYFADFPYLHSSLNYRLLTLETCCGLRYGYLESTLYASRILMWVLKYTKHVENRRALVHLFWPISGRAHSRSLCALRRKDNSSLGPQNPSPVTYVLPQI